MCSSSRLRSELVARTSRTGPCGWLWPAESALLAVVCCLVAVHGVAGWVGLWVGSASWVVRARAAVRGTVQWIRRRQRSGRSRGDLLPVVAAPDITGEVV